MNLPAWVKEFLHDKACPHCDEKMAIGVIECLGIKILDGGSAGLFFESRCPACKKTSQTILQNEQGFRPIELAAEIYNGLDDLSGDTYEYEIEDPSHRNSISSLSDNDIDEVKNFLKKNDLYVDFLYFIGCSDQEIEKYAKINLWEEDE
tara:strand:+ start:470 stop:916 length:447 start_codon:yes stop_codon:yes gene_type:complete